MALRTLEDLYVEQLQDLYSAETQLIDALPKMAKAASNTELKQGFEEHLAQTKEHKGRLEQVFKGLGKNPGGETCEAMKGLVEEGDEMMGMEAEPEVLDAGLIAAAQRVEHYEIAAYGTVCTFAEQLGRKDDHDILGRTLGEEEQTDQKLTKLAKTSINKKAA